MAEKLQRPSWDEYFLCIAHTVQQRSTCWRRQVGALVVRDKQILSTGYNGAPSGLPHCTIKTCLRTQQDIPSGERLDICRALHAEMNALLQGAKHGIAVKGATLYVTDTPCDLCAKMIINAGITRVVAVGGYPNTDGVGMLREAGVTLDILPA